MKVSQGVTLNLSLMKKAATPPFDADRRREGTFAAAVGEMVEEIVVLVLGESVDAGLQIVAFEVGVEGGLRAAVVGGLGRRLR